MEEITRKLLVITGATASGKTDLAIELANRLNGEIINADLLQMYRGMDIGTAKPSADQLQRVAHHFISFLEPIEQHSAGAFARSVHELVPSIFDRGKLPIVVGGSGLYVQALTEGIFKAPAVDLQLRNTLKEKLRREGLPVLVAELRSVDGEAAQRIDTSNPMRVLRALEIIHQTGLTLHSAWEAYRAPADFPSFVIGTRRTRDELYNRINERVLQMIDSGWIDEVRSLLEQGVSPDAPGLNAVGYREVIGYVLGRMDVEEMIRSIQQRTRNLAKRQETWLRKRSYIRWYDCSQTSLDQVSQRVCDDFMMIALHSDNP